jgi:mRNA interferase RelE/StbE
MQKRKTPNYRVFLHRKAEKFLDGLNEKARSRLLEDIAGLASFPDLDSKTDVAKLKGERDLFRLRTGNFRSVFFVDKATRTIFVLKIAPREAAYE